MSFRIAQEKDLENLIQFLKSTEIDTMFNKPLSQRDTSIEDRVKHKFQGGYWLLYLKDETISGCRAITYDEEKQIATLSTFALHPSLQGSGLGSKMYELSIDLARDRFKPQKIQVDSWSTNKISEKLALKFGFRKIQEYEDPNKRPSGVKTVVYELTL